MTESTQSPKQSSHLKRTAFILAAAWTAVIVLGACWRLLNDYENALEWARIQASHSFEKDLAAGPPGMGASTCRGPRKRRPTPICLTWRIATSRPRRAWI